MGNIACIGRGLIALVGAKPIATARLLAASLVTSRLPTYSLCLRGLEACGHKGHGIKKEERPLLRLPTEGDQPLLASLRSGRYRASAAPSDFHSYQGRRIPWITVLPTEKGERHVRA